VAERLKAFRWFVGSVPDKKEPTEAASIEATTELLDDLQQAIRVLLDDSALPPSATA